MKLEFEKGALRPIGPEELAAVRGLADDSTRGRAIVRYHEHAERVQRMLNAIEPESYIRPHKHERPDKLEVFIALRGRALICTFDESGNLGHTVEIGSDGPCYGVEIPPRVWHTLLALQPGTVLYEVIEGPYAPATHKGYAPWAPEEGSREGDEYHKALRRRLGL
jgi:cupin fold WbuC family metalloprotein